MKYIDMAAWPRREHFNFFRQMDYPHFALSGNVDVTETYNYCKEHNLSFFKVLVYIAMKTANEIPEFRYRIRGEQVVEHEMVHPSFTILRNDGVFAFCSPKFALDFTHFYANATKAMEERQCGNPLEEEADDDQIYVTSIPWVSFTHLAHPIHKNPPDSVPRIAWGKYFAENGRLKLPLSIQAHHALLDGYHMGQYFMRFEEALAQPQVMVQP